MRRLRRVVVLASAVLLLGLSAFESGAQEVRLFRIGSGGAGGTYFPIAKLIAEVVSRPPGVPCPQGVDNCGVPGLVAAAQLSNGSVANVTGLAAGVLEAGLAQADIAYWSFSGKGIFEGQPPNASLRMIATLYPEMVHLFATRTSGIRSVPDLRGKRVSLDEPGSGTLVGARSVLSAYGLTEQDIQPIYVKPPLAAGRMREGKLDAAFMIGGYPLPAITELMTEQPVLLVPIAGAQAEQLKQRHPFFIDGTIPAGAYPGVPMTPTLAVNALLLVRENLPEDTVYAITRALWQKRALDRLSQGHSRGRDIRLETALSSRVIPLHPGAERYYREVGLIK